MCVRRPPSAPSHLLELIDKGLVLLQLGPVAAHVHQQLVPVVRRHGPQLRQDEASNYSRVVHSLHPDVADEVGQLRGWGQQPGW